LSQKGHLGPGADADVTIYHEKPDDGRLFTYPRYVIKSGEIVVEDGDVRATTAGREFVVHPTCDSAIEEYLRRIFPKIYTMSFDNYPVEIERLRHAQIQPCQ
jgi:formylmethanofuran dehydrogenase subunit A